MRRARRHIQRLHAPTASPPPHRSHFHIPPDKPAGRPRPAQRPCAALRQARPSPQMLFFNADTGKAFTMVRAGLAFTTHIFPKISLLPAFVAGFTRVFTMHSPGIVNLPAVFNCFAATPPRLLITFMHSDFFSSVSEARASAKAPLVMGFAPDFIAFIAFIGAMVANLTGKRKPKERRRT